MKNPFLAVMGALVAVLAVSLAPVFVAAQNSEVAAAQAYTPPQTPWGEPDFQGIWSRNSEAPLERPEEYAGRAFLTDEEVAALDTKSALEPTHTAPPRPGSPGTYNAVFNSILKRSKRTSLIIDPPDGKMPPLVPGAEDPTVASDGFGTLLRPGPRGSDGPEDRGWPERCLGNTLPDFGSGDFGAGTSRLVQSPGYVTIYVEYGHGGGAVRIIPTDGSPHLPPQIHQRLGDSRGRWEGNTLVVDTTNFSPGAEIQTIGQWTLGPRGSKGHLHLVERFTRVDANTLEREITIDDPTTWTRPWTVLLELGKNDERANRIYESSCHEGNFGMLGILAGARAQEKKAAQTAGKKP